VLFLPLNPAVAAAPAGYQAAIGPPVPDLSCAVLRIFVRNRLLLQISTSDRRPAKHETGQTEHDTSAITDRFGAVITRGQAEGTVRPDLAPETLRFSLFGALAMSLRLVRAGAGDSPLSAQEIGTQVAGVIVDGLRPRATRAG
jgi:hypothetical protein